MREVTLITGAAPGFIPQTLAQTYQRILHRHIAGMDLTILYTVLGVKDHLRRTILGVVEGIRIGTATIVKMKTLVSASVLKSLKGSLDILLQDQHHHQYENEITQLLPKSHITNLLCSGENQSQIHIPLVPQRAYLHPQVYPTGQLLSAKGGITVIANLIGQRAFIQ